MWKSLHVKKLGFEESSVGRHSVDDRVGRSDMLQAVNLFTLIQDKHIRNESLMQVWGISNLFLIYFVKVHMKFSFFRRCNGAEGNTMKPGTEKKNVQRALSWIPNTEGEKEQDEKYLTHVF